MRVYRPNLLALPDGGRAQVFAANVVHIDDELVALGELIPDPRRGLPHGTPIHSLLIHLEDRAPSAFELNDQGNTVSASDVVRVDVEPGLVRIRFREGHGPSPGRVSLDPSIEMLHDESLTDEDGRPLRELHVAFEDDARTLEQLRERLRS